MQKLIALFAVIAILAHSVAGQACTSYQTYTLIDEEDYSFTYSQQPNDHPLGYYVGTYSNPVCIQVNNVQGKMIEIAAESFQNGIEFCVTDTESLLATTSVVTACGAGRLNSCFNSPSSNTLKFFFYGKNADVMAFNFHYRVRVSNVATTDDQNSATGNAAMWCAMLDSRNTTAYPKDLIAQVADANLNGNNGIGGSNNSPASFLTVFAFMPLLALVATVFAFLS